MNLQEELKKFSVIDNALKENKIAGSKVQIWLNNLDKDFEGTKNLIETIKPGVEENKSSADQSGMEEFYTALHMTKVKNNFSSNLRSIR